MGNEKEGGSDDITAKGKYLLISVPEFGTDPISGKTMTSYLRLGAASTTWETDPGGKLAKNIYLGGPPGGHLPEVMETVEERSPDYPFVDDRRFRGTGNENPAGGAGHGLDEGARKDVSKVLHTRGGWRDHSDGNRITTTSGDKIEVIRGNYKMIILGRQDETEDGAEFANATGWDASGQHIQDFAATMPGASVRVEWVKELYPNGVWHLQNTTENVQQTSRYAGTFKEEWWGDLKEAYIGQDKTAANAVKYMEDVEGTLLPRGNPELIEVTYARSMSSRTGSSSTRVPTIKEELWAESTEARTDVYSSREETYTRDTAYSYAKAGKIEEETEAGSTSSITKVDGKIYEKTEAQRIESKTNADFSSDTTQITGVLSETTLAGAMTSMTLAGNISELSIATHTTLDIGAGIGVQIGAYIDLFVGLKLEVAVAGSIAVNIGAFYDFTFGRKMEVCGSDRTKVGLTDKEAVLAKKILGANIQIG